MKVTVVGAGLAGCEAAWQLAVRGIDVILVEMKPQKKSPAHSRDCFCELVCSNSLRSADPANASGLLKSEMMRLGSLIMDCAMATKVAAGGALAVDRDKFGNLVTKKLKEQKNIEIVSEECKSIPDGYTIIATGPLTSEALAEDIQKKVGTKSLFFFDAAAPIVSHESVDFDHAFIADRYDKGEGDYINCPMTFEEYQIFWQELVAAQTVKFHDFENKKVFEGCVPVEVLASRGRDTLRFGPLKPVGLTDPKTQKRPYAVVQLRRENTDSTMYNLVGFQTRLLFPEQRRVFALIPALKNAEFLRYGVMHKNTYIQSPQILTKYYNMHSCERVFFAGQITGVEGYMESASSGMLAALNLYNLTAGREAINYTNTTAITSLACYISNEANTAFAPMNTNFGLFAPVEGVFKDKAKKKEAILQRAEQDFARWFGV